MQIALLFLLVLASTVVASVAVLHLCNGTAIGFALMGLACLAGARAIWNVLMP